MHGTRGGSTRPQQPLHDQQPEELSRILVTLQASLFQLWRFHAFFTTSDLDTVTADKTHRGHAIIEQVNADLKNYALAHLPSGSSPPTAPGWLVQSWRSTSPAPPRR